MPDQKREILVNAGCEAMSTYFDRPVSFGLQVPSAAEPVTSQEHADKIARHILRK